MEKLEGIILHTTRYRDRDLILQVMTRQMGRIGVMARAGTSRRRFGGSLPTPLVGGEIVCQQRKSSLWNLQELTLTHHFLGLRERLDRLEAGLDLAKVLLDSQHPEKPAPALYALLHWSLEKLAEGAPPLPMQCAFRLKVLRHEGYLSHPFGTPEEEPWITLLGWGRSTAKWEEVPNPHTLLLKIKQYFNTSLLS